MYNEIREQALTSIALRRAEISHACPSARAQKRELARAYSLMLESTSSSISNSANLATDESVGIFH